MIPPCQPIGCDNGYHLPGCAYAVVDAAPLDAAGRLVMTGVRVVVVAGDFVGRSGRVDVVTPASGAGVWRIPASVLLHLDGGGGLGCNADMVRVVG